MKFDFLKKDYFRLSSGREIAFSFIAGEGVPLVFLNGLGDSMDSWQVVLKLAGVTRPCLLVDLPGQGASLAEDIKQQRSWDYVLSVEAQVGHLSELLTHLRISRFGVVGFSYGGGVALGMIKQMGEKVEDVVLLLPFILRLDLSFPLSRFWVAQFDFLKALTPKSLRQPYEMLEKSYERFIEHYMNYRYLGRIPEEQHRQVAVQLSRGIMSFNSFHVIPELPEKKLVLLTSGMDTLVPQSLYQEFWYAIPERSKKAWVHVMDGEHLIIEQDPAFVAKFLQQALDGAISGEQKVFLKRRAGASSA